MELQIDLRINQLIGLIRQLSLDDKLIIKKELDSTFDVDSVKDNNEDMRNFTAQTGGLEFWNDSREDVYQDYLK